MRYLNLGCGNRFVRDWENVDFISDSLNVKSHNLLEGIPYPDESADVVYHSHLLEHLTKPDAYLFMQECFRVLKPGGVIRVVVPDLEQIVAEYLKCLSNAKCGSKEAKANYNWIMLEMYDQAVRNCSGGEMAKYWEKPFIENEGYVLERIGEELHNFRKNLKTKRKRITGGESGRVNQTLWKRVKAKLRKVALNALKLEECVRVGRFRLGGEVHQWMYDEYSLGELLESVGFKGIARKSGFESSIPGWEEHKFLDVEGSLLRKPDSLFMEAFK